MTGVVLLILVSVLIFFGLAHRVLDRLHLIGPRWPYFSLEKAS